LVAAAQLQSRSAALVRVQDFSGLADPDGGRRYFAVLDQRDVRAIERDVRPDARAFRRSR